MEHINKLEELRALHQCYYEQDVFFRQLTHFIEKYYIILNTKYCIT